MKADIKTSDRYYLLQSGFDELFFDESYLLDRMRERIISKRVEPLIILQKINVAR